MNQVNVNRELPTRPFDSLQLPATLPPDGEEEGYFSANPWVLRQLFKSLVSLSIASAVLLGGAYYFYGYSTQPNHHPWIVGGLLLSLSTDGLLLLINLSRPRSTPVAITSDLSKLTILIVCHNSMQVLGETLRQALRQVLPQQIIVVSDASTDPTAALARSFGVRVFENLRNINKGLSINATIPYVTTPYVLILDDDTHIGQTRIPTSLLDEGWSAVAFKVLPEPTGTVVNELQRFEYGKTMTIAKAGRRSIGAVSNISGAIGLYRTDYLRAQAEQHSGQAGGEDQQRTLFTHLQNEGKGVTYVDEAAYTKVPDTWRILFRQRAFRWNRSAQENFFLCWYILANPRAHILLKTEKVLQLFILLTDPLRIFFVWFIFLRPAHFAMLYSFYLVLNYLAWLRNEEKTSAWVVFLAPFYGFFKALCRFIAHFYWFKVKYHYVVTHQYHHLVTNRNLVLEYALVTLILVGLWSMALYRFQELLPSLLGVS